MRQRPQANLAVEIEGSGAICFDLALSGCVQRLCGRPSDRGRDGTRPSKMRNSNAVIYWLVPAKPERELFRKLISILGKQFDAPRFEPHLTILVTANGRHSPRTVLRQLQASPVRLRVRGMGFSPKFTKTLFVRFETNRSLEKLVANLGRTVKTRTQSVGDPHISLLYRKLPAGPKKELASTIRLPFQKVTFDSIKALRSTVPIRNRADVESWDVIATRTLHG